VPRAEGGGEDLAPRPDDLEGRGRPYPDLFARRRLAAPPRLGGVELARALGLRRHRLRPAAVAVLGWPRPAASPGGCARWRGLGLEQVLARTEPEAALDQRRLTVVGEDQDRDVPGLVIAPQCFEDGHTVHLRQAHVEEDQVRLLVAGDPEPLLTVGGNRDAVAVHLQLELVHVGDGRIVFYQQDMHNANSHGYRLSTIFGLKKRLHQVLRFSGPASGPNRGGAHVL